MLWLILPVDNKSPLVAVLPLAGCLLVIASKLRSAFIASKLRSKASRALQEISDERLLVTDIGWLVRHLLRARTAGVVVVIGLGATLPLVIPDLGPAFITTVEDLVGQRVWTPDVTPRSDADSEAIAEYASGRLIASFLLGSGTLLSELNPGDPKTDSMTILFFLIHFILWLPPIFSSVLIRRFLSNRTLGGIVALLLAVLIAPPWAELISDKTSDGVYHTGLGDLLWVR